jgi:hypothetical protein
MSRKNTHTTGTSNAQAESDSDTDTSQREAAQFTVLSAKSFQGYKNEYQHLRNQVLLDNQSTVDIFCNLNYLENIREVTDTLTLYTNGGILMCNTKGDLKGYGTVWCHPDAIANILGLSNVLDTGKYQVTFDVMKGFRMVNTKTGATTLFQRDASGLYTAPLGPEPQKHTAEVNLLSTVEQNKQLYTKRQVARADTARKLYRVIGFPSIRDFKHLIQTNQIKNCPVTVDDIKIYEAIYGADEYAMKGKSTRRKPKVVVNDYVEVPRELIEAHKHIVLCMDIMFIDQVPMLVTVSKYIKYITVRYIKNRSDSVILEALGFVFTTYNAAGFVIKEIHCDREFESIQQDIERDFEVVVNLASAQEHQPDVERTLRTIKERYRAMYHMCPYKMWPRLMVIRGASEAAKWLNSFPPAGGLSPTYSPRSIILGRPIDYTSQCTVSFGSYVQAYSATTNTPQERTIDAIFLRALDTFQGGYEVMNLKTGHAITRHRVTELPIPKHVIARVEALAKNDGFLPHVEPIFRTYALIAGVDDPPDSESDDGSYQYDSNDDDTEHTDQEELNDIANDGLPTPGVGGNHFEQANQDNQEDDQSIGSDASHVPEPEPDDEPVPEPPRRSTREHKPRQILDVSGRGQRYEYIGVNNIGIQENPQNTLEYDGDEAVILARAFAQTYSLMKGIKKFGTVGEEAVFAEIKQLHDRECFRPIHANDMTPEMRRQAMESIMFLTEKRDGTIKARNVTDGRKQRTWMSKEEAASPTVLLESLILTCVIDAKEGREVAIADIPHAFVQTPNIRTNKDHPLDIMKVKGKLVELLVLMDPNLYAPYVTQENNKPVIYVEILKALYGMIKSPLLFYRKLRKDLEDVGFKINPYDVCVANKVVDGYQLTVAFHVDDLKISHVTPKVVDRFLEWVKEMYEDPGIKKITPSRGKIHDYLGMTLDFSIPGKVKLLMKEYIMKMLSEFPYQDQLKALKAVRTPAAGHLFVVNEESEKLEAKVAEDFHTTVAKGLFLCKRARPDLQPTVPFLCTRVTQPDIDDWKKLKRMLKYLELTQDLELTLEADKGQVIFCRWYADAAFAVHQDMKSHTGAVLTLGKGAVNTISAKQKLNTKSSTEAELVGADTVVSIAMWTKMFLEEQGYTCETTVLQDNTSAMLLEKNGAESSSKRTRHINVRYYYIKDCIDKGHLQVQYCPTDDMLGDYPSKPLQGRKFEEQRRLLMNLS